MKKFLIATLTGAAVMTTPALASTEGTLSHHHSVGTVTVGTYIPRLVEISGLTDLKLKITAAALNSPYFSRQDANETFCVYSNVGAQGGYNLKIDGTASNAQSPFQLTGAGGTLNYNVWVSDNTSNAFLNYVYPGDVEKNYATNADGKPRRTTTTCSVEGADANLHIGVNNTDILAAQSGYYKGTLTLTVSPI